MKCINCGSEKFFKLDTPYFVESRDDGWGYQELVRVSMGKIEAICCDKCGHIEFNIAEEQLEKKHKLEELVQEKHKTLQNITEKYTLIQRQCLEEIDKLEGENSNLNIIVNDENQTLKTINETKTKINSNIQKRNIAESLHYHTENNCKEEIEKITYDYDDKICFLIDPTFKAKQRRPFKR